MADTRNATELFADYIVKLGKSPLPERVINKAKECMLDYIGVAYAGATANKSRMENLISEKTGDCEILGLDVKTNSREAAFINAFNAHTIELDDGSRFGMIHLSAGIIPAVVAAAQEKGLSCNNVLKGIILGYEAAVRVSLAMQPGHKKRGFHTSGTCGLIGAAVGAACAMECNAGQLKAVISAAATSASGLLEIQEDASTLKPYNLGHAAMAGLNAAYVGMVGFIGPADILYGKRGMFRLFSDDYNREKLVEERDYFEIERIYVKPYAACRHCHSAIEAALKIRNENAIPSEEIKKIEIKTYELAVRGHDHREIQGIASAKLSMPFSVAAAYTLGTAGMEAFTDQTINNAEILKLAQKVEVINDETITTQSKDKRVAEVSVIAENDKADCRVEYAKGDPENPLTQDEIVEKFEKLMIWSGNADKIDEIKIDVLEN